MPRSSIVFAVLAILVSCLTGGNLVAQDAAPSSGDIARYQLERVAVVVKKRSVLGRELKPLRSLFADERGGRAQVGMFVTDTCTEKVRFEWKFSRDITQLKPGDTFTIELTAKSSHCPENTHASSRAWISGSGGVLSREMFDTIPASDRDLFQNRNGMKKPHNATVYCKDIRNYKPVGKASFELTVPDKPSNHGAWFAINLMGEARKGGSLTDKMTETEIAYLYRGFRSPEPPGEFTVDRDNPRPDQDATVTIQPGGAGNTDGAMPPNVAAADRCLDPDVQRCIDLWIELATKLRNEKRPDLGPWSVSKYGHFINKNIVAVAAPDGWEDKYHSSHHCFLWMNSGRAHEHPDYGGELPALHQFVENCLAGNLPPGIDRPGDGPGDMTGDQPGGGTGDRPGDGPGVRPGEGPGGDSLPPAGGRLGDLNLTIAYPTDLVRLADSTGGKLSATTLFDLNSKPVGTVRVGLADQKGITGEFALCRLDFELIGRPGDVAVLDGEVTSAHRTDDTPVKFNVIDGQIRILADATQGDFNGDGEITSLDALAALRMSIGKLPEQLILDVDSSGSVTAKDARLIMGMAVGTTPIPGGITSTSPTGMVVPQANMSGPTILISSAAQKSGETVSIVVKLLYE